MGIVETLTLEERARQLRNPEGLVGLAVANWTSAQNRSGQVKTVRELQIKPHSQVLEIGFGDGRAVPEIISQAYGVQYFGIDISPTMVKEAERFNAHLVAAGQAQFFLGSAQQMPFKDDAFDRIFSIGVMHFWADPEVALAELHRVLRPDGLMLMGCLSAKAPPAFARAEFGFYLHEANVWAKLCHAAGFSALNVSEIETHLQRADGTMIPLQTVRLEARP